MDVSAAGIVESAAEDELDVYATFEENALAKAKYFHARSGLPTFADDSGLEVDALGGAPGVRSKRWTTRTTVCCSRVSRERRIGRRATCALRRTWTWGASW